MAEPSKKPPKKIDYEQLGRAIEAIVLSGYFDRFRLYRMSFMRGIFSGLGSVIGATIVLAILLWLLSLAESIPFIGTIFENIQDTVDSPPDAL